MALVLLLGLIAICFLSLQFLDKDLLSPVNSFLLFSVLSAASLFLMYREWRVGEYGVYVVFIYLAGAVFFLAGCMLAKKASVRAVSGRTSISALRDIPVRTELHSWKILLAVIVSAAALYGTCRYIGKVTGIPLSSFENAIVAYRALSTEGLLAGENAKGTVFTILSWLSAAFAYCTLLVFIKNAVYRSLRRKDVFLLLPFIFRSAEYLLESSRAGVINLLCAAFVSWFISLKCKEGWNKPVNRKVVLTGICFGVFFVLFFLGAAVLTGRGDALTALGMKNYTVAYSSGGIRNLDLFLKETAGTPLRMTGEETFAALRNDLFFRFGIGQSTVRHLPFQSVGDVFVGNVYTAFRRFYHDFGFAGILILPLIQGFLLSFLYYHISRGTDGSRIGLAEVLYMCLADTVIFIAVDDIFYSSWISVTGITNLIILAAVYFLMFRIPDRTFSVQAGSPAVYNKSISVAMASYNGEEYIERQIRSICSQLAAEDELVISDDGSTDGTVAVIERLQKTYPAIRLIPGPGKGVFRNFENAVAHAEGEIIFLADQDDVWKPDKVKTVMAAFRDEKTVLVLHDADLLMGENETEKRLLRPYRRGVIRNLFLSSYWGCCMAFRRSFLMPYLPFASAESSHDQLIGLLAERVGGTVYLPDILLSHRIHSGNQTRSLSLPGKIRFRVNLLRDYRTAVSKKRSRSGE